MSNKEILYKLVLAISPVMVDFLICIGVVAITIGIFYFLQRNIWVNSKHFSIISFFYGLNAYDSFCIACAYIELILLIIYLVQFKQLETIHYLVYLVPSLFFILKIKDIKALYKRLLWFIGEFGGLIVSNIICSYILNVYNGAIYIVLYVLVSIWVLLLGIYRFLYAFEEVSDLRGAEFE